MSFVSMKFKFVGKTKKELTRRHRGGSQGKLIEPQSHQQNMATMKLMLLAETQHHRRSYITALAKAAKHVVAAHFVSRNVIR